jgi:hypothetical protein
MNDIDPSQDPAETARHFILDDGLKIDAVRTNPYGFWHVKYRTGTPPEELKGQYTGFDQLKKAVSTYVINTNRKIVKIEPGSSAPNLAPGATEKDIYDPPKPRFKVKHDTLSLQ